MSKLKTFEPILTPVLSRRISKRNQVSQHRVKTKGMQMGKKYGYVRVSTRGQAQDGNSLMAQKELFVRNKSVDLDFDGYSK